jgi:hypothetical protein
MPKKKPPEPHALAPDGITPSLGAILPLPTAAGGVEGKVFWERFAAELAGCLVRERQAAAQRAYRERQRQGTTRWRAEQRKKRPRHRPPLERNRPPAGNASGRGSVW